MASSPWFLQNQGWFWVSHFCLTAPQKWKSFTPAKWNLKEIGSSCINHAKKKNNMLVGGFSTAKFCQKRFECSKVFAVAKIQKLKRQLIARIMNPRNQKMIFSGNSCVVSACFFVYVWRVGTWSSCMKVFKKLLCPSFNDRFLRPLLRTVPSSS